MFRFCCCLFALCTFLYPLQNVYAQTSALGIKKISLIDGNSGKVITELPKNNERIYKLPAELLNHPLDIKIVPKTKKIRSILFSLTQNDGNYSTNNTSKVRNARPFRYKKGNKKYNSWVLKDNSSYSFSVIPYRKKNAKGLPGQINNFTIVTTSKSIPTPTPTPLPTISSDVNIWANDGGDKVTKDELRVKNYGKDFVKNSVWDGKKITLFAARNETVSFNLIVEAAAAQLKSVRVELSGLYAKNGSSITSRSAQGDDIFDYTSRNIEIFAVRYLQIKGLSHLGYDVTYDERHIPQRLRRPIDEHKGIGTWEDRPDHDKYYPDIAVPQEIAGDVNVSEGENQSFWVDIYVPKNSPAAIYNGNLLVYQEETLIKTIPVSLKVRKFALPDEPASKTMLYIGYSDINNRFIGEPFPYLEDPLNRSKLIRNRYFQMAHRHHISLIDGNENSVGYEPSAEWKEYLTGRAFTSDNGYEGYGAGVGNNVFSIGTYGSWNESLFNEETAGSLVKWFEENAPTADYFLYLIDESTNFDYINQIAALTRNASSGKLKSFATADFSKTYINAPELDIACSTVGLGVPDVMEDAANFYQKMEGKSLYFYNGHRPQSGTFMIEDDGVALRELAWGQYKKGIERWFYWESTYYNNFQGGLGETDVFNQAQTFGGNSGRDISYGESGWNYSNGDGVLFYPGTDLIFPESSYNVDGPIASLRLKHWRRGIQDVDYLTLAAKKDPNKVKEIVKRLIPKVLWEYGVNDPSDPSWITTDISWSNNPDVWEKARAELADIIEK